MLPDAIFLAVFVALLEKKSIASCQIHVTRSNLELEIVSVVKINAVIAESRTEYNCRKLKEVVRQVNVAKESILHAANFFQLVI